ncbi:MAG TPA: hypothetical protein VER96_27835 [Polyangiaceae bacterium]|nr:hypothetical protein [Polyangiaceae bacterium]
MVRSRRAWFGAGAVVFTCSLACACSSARSTAHEAGGASNEAQPASGGERPSAAGTGASDSNESGASFGGTGPAEPNSGGAASANPSAGGKSSATGGNTASAGTSGSTSSGGRRVFYLDVQGSVRAFDEDKPTPRTLVSSAGKGPDGIAVDVAGGHVYWTTMGVPADNDGSLLRSELDGSKMTTIVAAGGSYTPKQLKLDLAARQLYWSDREGMRIQRAATDGTGLETLVTVATGDSARKNAENWCVGLALDVAHGFVYWTQKGPDNGMVGSIRRAHLQMPNGETASTRTDIEILFDKLPEPVDLDLDLAAGQMYWSDRGDDTISRAAIEIPSGKTAATRGDREILVRGVREAIGVTLDLERGHVYYTSGASGRVGRANLDGSGAVDLVTGTGALTGIAVVP